MALKEERKTKIFNDKNYIKTSYLIIISFLESITVAKKKTKSFFNDNNGIIQMNTNNRYHKEIGTEMPQRKTSRRKNRIENCCCQIRYG